MVSFASAVALSLATLVALGLIIGFSVQSSQINPALPLVQSGNFTWDLLTNGGGTLADSLVVPYMLYQGPTYYLLQLNSLPRPLAISAAGGGTVPQPYVTTRIHNFAPVVKQLYPLSWYEYVLPLAQRNLEAIFVDGPCFLSLTPTCVIAGWPNDGVLGESAISFILLGNAPLYDPTIQFSLQTSSGENQLWENYTLSTTQPLQLQLFSV